VADIFAIAARHREELLQRERQSAVRMVEAYGAAWQRIRHQLGGFESQIAQARALGTEISPAWLLQRDRLQSLQRQVEAEIAHFARFAEGQIWNGQQAAVDAAQAHAEELAGAGLGPPPPGVTLAWDRLPTDALTDLVGFLGDGSPLRTLLDELGPDASAAVRKALIAGVATGQNPTAIARTIREALGGNLVRALTISRTEVLRSYREASRRSYHANRDIVTGWLWQAGLSSRTCASCWAMHGSFHRLDERLDDHPRGRCTMLPVTKTWAELGFPGVPETRIEVQRGPDLFAKLPAAEQREILGPARYAAYRQGLITLDDLVHRSHDPRWGTMRREASLREVLGNEEARRLVASTRAGGSGGGTPPAGPPRGGSAMPPAERAARQIEERIRHNPTESLYALDAAGAVVFTKAGGQRDIALDLLEVARLRATVLTHNHPGGNALSLDDLQVATIGDLQQIRAVTADWRFIMQRPAGGWDLTFFRRRLAPAYRRHWETVLRELLLAVNDGQLSEEAAAALHLHETWMRVARELGVEYRREP